MDFLDKIIEFPNYFLAIFGLLLLVKLLSYVLSLIFKRNESLSEIGYVSLILSVILFVFIFIYYAVVYPLIHYTSDGNIGKAIIVISVLGISIYLLIILITSLFAFKNRYAHLAVSAEIVKKRKLHVLIFRSTLLLVGIWSLFAARDLTVLLYKDTKFKLVDFLEASEISINDSWSLDVIPGTLIFAIVVAIILFAFTLNIYEDKPFLKIVRYWKWLHYPQE